MIIKLDRDFREKYRRSHCMFFIQNIPGAKLVTVKAVVPESFTKVDAISRTKKEHSADKENYRII